MTNLEPMAHPVDLAAEITPASRTVSARPGAYVAPEWGTGAEAANDERPRPRRYADQRNLASASGEGVFTSLERGHRRLAEALVARFVETVLQEIAPTRPARGRHRRW